VITAADFHWFITHYQLPTINSRMQTCCKSIIFSHVYNVSLALDSW